MWFARGTRKLVERVATKSRAGGRHFARAVIWLLLAPSGAFLSGLARAQTAPPAPAAAGPDQPSYLTPAPLRTSNPLLTRSRDYTGVSVSDWIIYPEFEAAGVYNDNLTQAQSGRIGASGARLQPDVYGVRDSGISKTIIYGSADAHLYPSQPRDDTYDGRMAISQAWELQPDLTVKGGVEYDRLSYLTEGGLIETPDGTAATLAAPQEYQQLLSSAAVQKALGRYFLGVSINEAQTTYDSLSTSQGSFSQGYRDSSVTTLTERGGYWISPMLYGYAETAENWRQYVNDPFTSHGYRALAGLGSDRIGLFRGEVYGGYQAQYYDASPIGTAVSPVLGGKLFWYPTRALTLSSSIGEAFSDSSTPTPTNPRGDPAHVTSAQLNANYQLDRRWSAQGFARFDVSQYLGVDRIDETWTAELGAKREIARNFNIILDYTYIRVHSNALGASYSNNIVSLGGLYKF